MPVLEKKYTYFNHILDYSISLNTGQNDGVP